MKLVVSVRIELTHNVVKSEAHSQLCYETIELLVGPLGLEPRCLRSTF